MGTSQSKTISDKIIILYKTKIKHFDNPESNISKLSANKIEKVLKNDLIKVPSSFKHNLGFIVTHFDISKNYTVTIYGKGSKSSFKSQIKDGIGENGHVIGKHRFYLYKP